MSVFRRKILDEFDEEYLDREGFWEDAPLEQRKKLRQEWRERRLRKKEKKEEAKREALSGREVSKEENDSTKEENVNVELDEEIKKVMSKEELMNMAENSCDQMMACQEHLENIKKEYREINNYLSDIEKIERLEEPLKKELETEVRRIRNLSEDKNNYKHAAARMSDTKFELIESREKEMPKIMRDLKNDEDYMSSIQTDMHHLEGEKHALLYEREMYLMHMNLIRKIFAAVIILAIVLLIGFTIGQMNGKYDYTIGYYIVTVLALIALAIILVARQNEERELKLTELKLNKAIGLLNRYKLRYVNLRSSIDYTYQTYGVSNAYQLNDLWGKYITAKKEREAYFTMSENLYKANNRFLEIIESIGLYDASVWNYQMYAIIDGEEMMVIKNTLLNRKESVKKNMDYNSNIIRNSKEKITNIIKEHPELAESVLALVERKEKELEKGLV